MIDAVTKPQTTLEKKLSGASWHCFVCDSEWSSSITDSCLICSEAWQDWRLEVVQLAEEAESAHGVEAPS
ncbi:MAG: hypothetical protein ACI97A_000317 [Planctomycetota bacterium]|jgi:hypothetical protein